MIYFKFNESNCQESDYQIDNKEEKTLWHRFIKYIKIKTDCNPDYTKNYKRILTWYIEYDDVKYNLPIKEFGIDVNGNILFLAPSKNNFGFWCDVDADIDFYKRKFNITYITAEEFYSYWNSYPQK